MGEKLAKPPKTISFLGDDETPIIFFGLVVMRNIAFFDVFC